MSKKLRAIMDSIAVEPSIAASAAGQTAQLAKPIEFAARHGAAGQFLEVAPDQLVQAGATTLPLPAVPARSAARRPIA